MMGPDAMMLVFWMLSLKPTFSLSFFTFIKRLFSSSLSAVRVASSAYLRLLISLPAILIPASASSSPASHFSAYKLNKQGDDIQSWQILSRFGTSLLFHVQFYLLLLDLYTDFSRGRSGGLVFPYLEKFFTVCCDPHSQRLWHSQ